MTSEISISSNDSSVLGVGGLPTHGNSESSVLPITGHKLNGLNYLQCSQSVFMFISGKGKEDYLTGTIETPSKDDPIYKKWNPENHMVMSWLINTMNLEIGQNFMFYETAKEICENVKETYSDNENTSELFEIKVFGCSAFVHIPPYLRGKLDPKAVKCIFIDYSSSKKGYKCYSPEKKKVYNTMDVTFFENQSFYPKTSIQGENSATSKDEYQFWHLYNASTDSFPLISHINPENNTESTSQEEKSPPNFYVQNTGKWKNLVYSRKPIDNEVEHPILPEPYQDPNPSTVPAESGDDYEEMNRLKTILPKEFEIKDLGKLKYFLGMEVARSNKGISISQRKYTLDLLKETGMIGCKPVDTPMDPTYWAGSITNRRSASGYCTYVWSNLVTWRSKKQYVVSRSSAEAEFRAIALGICEGMWLKRLLKELNMTKHVEIDRHFIREKIEGGIIQMVYTPSSHQTADILTKALPKVNFDNLNFKLGMINIYSQLEGE
ncbi:hypothetical protein RJ640_007068 [Escallonia rubra]|uniref:Reverse transcriptase Ty1/copia-type domain-containing protein n=1 Tax=Escallonia rubra TaxID=112253 RepID=A0AA88U647_9ASTE|nr:hypothetical protein RJ640_007068 [Escallonia rubra]